FGKFDLPFAEGFAVGFVRILLVRRAVADVAVDDDERGLVGATEKSFVAAGELQQIVGVGDTGDVPAVADKARHHVFAERPTGRAIESDTIVVVDQAKIRKAKMPRKRDGFAGYAFHQVAVAADGVNAVIKNIEPRLVVGGRQPFSRDGHAHSVTHSLAERAGGGFHTGGEMRFGMSGSAAVELPETL